MLKKALRSAIRATAKVPAVERVVFHPAVRNRLRAWPVIESALASGWHLRHPFDRQYRVDTSGFVQAELLESSPHESGKIGIYAGSQPSIIRTALNALPPLTGYAFVDLGCGKGRPLMVASEFPFRSLSGVELTPSLVAQARKNAAIIARRFSHRTPITIEQQDASLFQVPAGNAVIFLYNPFGATVVRKVVARIEEAIARDEGTKFIVYYNPVHGDCFDASASLRRFFAANLPYASEEIGFGPDSWDSLVIWQAKGTTPAHGNASGHIKVLASDVRAQIV